MAENLDHAEWKGTTGGMPWMQRSLVWMLATIDQRILYGVLLFVVPFYMIFSHMGYISQYHFFRERFGESCIRAFFHVYVNHFKFGQIIIDRFAVYGGRKFKLEFDGYDLWTEVARQDDGFVQVSSHIGNYELAGYSLKSQNKAFNALVFLGETETVMKNRNKVFAPNNIKMVPVMPDMSHIFELNTALSNGEIVSMPGDRIFGSQKSVTHEFLGKEAKFPVGPFSLAATRGCRMLSVFCMKKDWQTYYIRVRELPMGDSGKRSDQINSLSTAFVSELEKIVREYPTEWFNYYDFWK